MKSGIKVIAPASISNLACGFDVLGLALDTPCDEVIGYWSETPGVRIASVTGRKEGIPVDPLSNTAGVAVLSLLEHLGEKGRGVELKIHKHIQGGSGLGSSAASAVSAVVLVNSLLNNPLEKQALIPFAIEGEKLASVTPVGDNVVPEMLGGLHLIRDIAVNDHHRIYTPPGLFVAVLLPDFIVSTRQGRALLSQEVPLEIMVRQSANLGAFIIGMNTGDLDLIGRSMRDLVIEPQRKPYIPHFDRLQAMAMEMGALGCSISGTGPAVFALCPEKGLAEEIAYGMARIYDKHGLACRKLVCGIHPEGAQLM